MELETKADGATCPGQFNLGIIAWSTNMTTFFNVKHIQMKFPSVLEYAKHEVVEVQHLCCSDKRADSLNKVIMRAKVSAHCSSLGV